MRPTKRLMVACALLLAALVLGGCRAQGMPEPSPNEPSSIELVEQPKLYDGTELEFEGEVIGEAMVRGDYAWLHVNDDPYYLTNVEEGAQLGGYNNGMPVWVPAAEVDAITYYGNYKHEGDVVVVHGTFNAACPEHGGDTDIHATSFEIKAVGHRVVDEVRPEKIFWALVLGVLAALLWALERYWGQITEALGRE